ncbi:O-antigen polymerase [Acinetobacter indicus]|uniref:O-antigen polymerase n=1 Tax=Acinetobacter indicus TaxID=756892 RepID=UPI0013D7B1B0|nr:O-antigen polymerase [Acinetobacter indicus]
MEIILYIVCFLIPLLFNYKFYGFNGSTFLLFIYFIGTLCALYVAFFTTMFDSDRLSIYAVTYHLVCLFLLLFPIVNFGNKLKGYRLDDATLKVFTFVIIFFSFMSLFLYLPDVIEVFKMGLSQARVAFYMGTLKAESDGLLEYLKLPGKGLSLVAPFFLFYYIVNYPEKKLLIYLLLISSMVDVLFTLTNAGRGGLIRWAFVMIYFYLTFKNEINSKLKKYITSSLTILGVAFFSIFMITTVGRFSDREHSILDYILSYAGQPYIYFSYQFFDFFDITSYGTRIFKIFSSDVDDTYYLDMVTGQLDYGTNTFSTLAGDFYKDLGFYFTFLLCLFHFILYLFVYKTNVFNRLKVFKITLFSIMLCIVLNGYFYYQYSSASDTKIFLLVLFFSLFIPVFEKTIVNMQKRN